MPDISRILVVGAASPLGFDIVRRLAAQGKNVTAAYRRPRPGLDDRLRQAGAAPIRLDMGDRENLRRRLLEQDGAIFTPILTVGQLAAPLLREDQTAVFYSSNNVAVVPDDPMYASLACAERQVHAAAPQAAILRPTMIYGGPDNGNLARLMLAFRRWPVMLRPACSALQQPVFFEDLGGVAVSALLGREYDSRTIAVGGPDVLGLRALYAAVAREIGSRRPILPVPVKAAAHAVRGLQKLGVVTPVSALQLRRACLDKTARGDDVITTATPLEIGLKKMADELRRQGRI